MVGRPVRSNKVRYQGGSVPLPRTLEPMQDDRNQLVSIVEELEGPLEAEDRADLAGELVRFCARYEDIKEQAVYPP